MIDCLMEALPVVMNFVHHAAEAAVAALQIANVIGRNAKDARAGEASKDVQFQCPGCCMTPRRARSSASAAHEVPNHSPTSNGNNVVISTARSTRNSNRGLIFPKKSPIKRRRDSLQDGDSFSAESFDQLKDATENGSRGQVYIDQFMSSLDSLENIILDSFPHDSPEYIRHTPIDLPALDLEDIDYRNTAYKLALESAPERISSSASIASSSLSSSDSYGSSLVSSRNLNTPSPLHTEMNEADIYSDDSVNHLKVLNNETSVPESPSFKKNNMLVNEQLQRTLLDFLAAVGNELHKTEVCKSHIATLLNSFSSLCPQRSRKCYLTISYPFSDELGHAPAPNLDVYNSIFLGKAPQFTRSPRWTIREREALARGIRLENQRIFAENVYRQIYENPEVLEVSKKHLFNRKLKEIKLLPSLTLEMNVHGLNWERISSMVGMRSVHDCINQWTVNDHPLINKDEWTEAEVQRLAVIAAAHNARNWPLIAEKLGTNRTASQCFIYYQKNLNRTHIKSRWEPEEDRLLSAALRVFGEGSWQTVANCLDGRVGQQCLHRWDKTLRPTIKKGKWSPDEDKALLQAVERFGRQAWFRIQQHVPGRTDVQCRERYCNVLDPDLRQGPWTIEEDELLLKLVDKHGCGRWSCVSRELPGRTDNQCSRRWKKIANQRVDLQPNDKDYVETTLEAIDQDLGSDAALRPTVEIATATSSK